MTIQRICIAVAMVFAMASVKAQQAVGDSLLRRYAAEMLMVGFKGDSITPQSDAVRYVRDLHVGGIILFDVDLTGTKQLGSRNITNRERLRRLTRELQGYGDGMLLIALDQEGGRVARLKPQYGYQPTVSHRYLGEANNRDTTVRYARQMAEELAWSGVNMNLAPDIDVNVNVECPVIGRLGRSFSADTAVVTQHAGWFIDAHHQCGVMCAVKHFPGHGSSAADSHYGLTDVTDTWQCGELHPFMQLIAEGKIDAVMTAHIFNRRLDAELPATLSHNILTGVLRNELGFEGVILTDDMYMQGIVDNYKIEDAIALAINAGADMLVMGNNITTGYEPDRPFKVVEMIVNAVKAGKIPPERLQESYERIRKLKNRLK
ncbi:MAG: glycoside hydrolase family 3 protein [Muribaculaceae bacterium]